MTPVARTVLAVVTARAGSRRLPGKNLMTLWGVPLLGLACRAAAAARCVTRVVLSTEDPELARVGAEHGAEVPFLRPARLASDEASSIDVLVDLLATLESTEGYRPDYLLLLQPTSPLRSVSDIDAAFSRLVGAQPTGAIISVTAAKPPSWTEAMSADGRLLPTELSAALPASATWAVPNGGFYIASCEYLLQQRGFDGPSTLGYLTDPLLAIDVDTAEDFDSVRRLVEAGLSAPPPPPPR